VLGRFLDPIDRLTVTIYSILVLLTFTLAFRIFRLGEYGSQPVQTRELNDLLLGALGAVVAWALIDGVMYALLELFQRGERHRLLRQLEAAPSEQARVDIVAEEFDYILEPISGEMERQQLYRGVVEHLRGGQPRSVGFKREDLTGGVAWMIMAILAVVPSLLPLALLRENPGLAIRVSNIISFAMLFQAGHQWGVHTSANPWKTGLLLLGVGIVLVAIAIPLGG
jgi:hypothetical protein